MQENEAIDRVITALEKVPEKHLMIIEMANSIPLKGGDLDIDVLTDKIPEINLATAEAVAYGNHTIMAVEALVRLQGQEDDL